MLQILLAILLLFFGCITPERPRDFGCCREVINNSSGYFCNTSKGYIAIINSWHPENESVFNATFYNVTINITEVNVTYNLTLAKCTNETARFVKCFDENCLALICWNKYKAMNLKFRPSMVDTSGEDLSETLLSSLQGIMDEKDLYKGECHFMILTQNISEMLADKRYFARVMNYFFGFGNSFEEFDKFRSFFPVDVRFLLAGEKLSNDSIRAFSAGVWPIEYYLIPGNTTDVESFCTITDIETKTAWYCKNRNSSMISRFYGDCICSSGGFDCNCTRDDYPGTYHFDFCGNSTDISSGEGETRILYYFNCTNMDHPYAPFTNTFDCVRHCYLDWLWKNVVGEYIADEPAATFLSGGNITWAYTPEEGGGINISFNNSSWFMNWTIYKMPGVPWRNRSEERYISYPDAFQEFEYLGETSKNEYAYYYDYFINTFFTTMTDYDVGSVEHFIPFNYSRGGVETTTGSGNIVVEYNTSVEEETYPIPAEAEIVRENVTLPGFNFSQEGWNISFNETYWNTSEENVTISVDVGVVLNSSKGVLYAYSFFSYPDSSSLFAKLINKTIFAKMPWHIRTHPQYISPYDGINETVLKPYECLRDSDCIVGYCDKNIYRRETSKGTAGICVRTESMFNIAKQKIYANPSFFDWFNASLSYTKQLISYYHFVGNESFGENTSKWYSYLLRSYCPVGYIPGLPQPRNASYIISLFAEGDITAKDTKLGEIKFVGENHSFAPSPYEIMYRYGEYIENESGIYTKNYIPALLNCIDYYGKEYGIRLAGEWPDYLPSPPFLREKVKIYLKDGILPYFILDKELPSYPLEDLSLYYELFEKYNNSSADVHFTENETALLEEILEEKHTYVEGFGGNETPIINGSFFATNLKYIPNATFKVVKDLANEGPMFFRIEVDLSKPKEEIVKDVVRKALGIKTICPRCFVVIDNATASVFFYQVNLTNESGEKIYYKTDYPHLFDELIDLISYEYVWNGYDEVNETFAGYVTSKSPFEDIIEMGDFARIVYKKPSIIERFVFNTNNITHWKVFVFDMQNRIKEVLESGVIGIIFDPYLIFTDELGNYFRGARYYYFLLSFKALSTNYHSATITVKVKPMNEWVFNLSGQGYWRYLGDEHCKCQQFSFGEKTIETPYYKETTIMCDGYNESTNNFWPKFCVDSRVCVFNLSGRTVLCNRVDIFGETFFTAIPGEEIEKNPMMYSDVIAALQGEAFCFGPTNKTGNYIDENGTAHPMTYTEYSTYDRHLITSSEKLEIIFSKIGAKGSCSFSVAKAPCSRRPIRLPYYLKCWVI